MTCSHAKTMNTKQKQRLVAAETAAVLNPVADESDYAPPSTGAFTRDEPMPLGLQSHDSLEILASSAPLEETDPTTHLRIQLGERVVNGKYEVRVAYRIDDSLGEPFRAINPDRERAYRAAAKFTFHRMQDHDAKTFEINPFAWIKPPVNPPYEAASEEKVAYFQAALTRRIEQKYGPRKD